MTRKPLNVLVCLYILSTIFLCAPAWGYNGTGAPTAPGIQGEALSGDPTVQTLPPLRSDDRLLTPQRKTPKHSSSGSSSKQYPA